MGSILTRVQGDTLPKELDIETTIENGLAVTRVQPEGYVLHIEVPVFQEKEIQVHAEMAEVISLKELCLCKISSHVWRHKFKIDLLIAKMEDRYQNGQKEFSKKYQKATDAIVEGINKIDIIPKSIKLYLSLSVIDLILEVESLCEELIVFLDEENTGDLLNILNNIVITQSGHVDRANTIIRAFIATHCKLNLNKSDIGLICNITKEKFEKFIERYKITDTKLIENVCYFVTKYNVKAAWNNDTILDLSQFEIALGGSVRGHMEIFEYFYNKQKDNNKEAWLSRVLVNLIKENGAMQPQLKIIFIYKRLNGEVWKNIIRLYGSKIIEFLFRTSHTEYLITFYKQVCLYASDQCNKILELFFLNISCNWSFGCCSNVYLELTKEQFIKVWYHTPSNFKNTFVTNAKYNIFGMCNDYNIIKTVINDKELTEPNRKQLLYYTFLYNKTSSDVKQDIVDHLVKDFDLDDKYLDPVILKEVFIKHFAELKPDINSGIFKSDQELLEFKKEFCKDGKSIMKTIDFFYHSHGDPLEALQELFDWGFTEEEAVKFFKEVLIYDEIFINLYHLCLEYEMEDDSDEENDDDSDDGHKHSEINETSSNNIIEKMLENETVIAAMKKMMKETDFVKNVIKKIFGHKTIKYCFKNLLTDAEKCEAIKSYLLSEEGLVHLLKIFIHNTDSDIKYVETFVTKVRIPAYFTFDINWLRPYGLEDDLLVFIMTNGHKIYHKHFKPPTNLLPHQSLQHFKSIVNYYFSIFACLISADHPRKYFLENKSYEKMLLRETYNYLRRTAELDVPKLFRNK